MPEGPEHIPRLAMAGLVTCVMVVIGGCTRTEENGKGDEHGGISECEIAPCPERSVNSIGMAMRLIPGGTFTMGSFGRKDASDAFRRIEPPHPVAIAAPFWIGITEVTNSQFHAFVAATGYTGGTQGEDNLLRHMSDPCYVRFRASDQPVTFVSWHDAVAFCEWLGRQENRQYHLPTEEEWEYACRGGIPLEEYTDDRKERLPDFAWCRDNAAGRPHPVAQKLANAWGLHDMLGNVWEWTSSMFLQDLLIDTGFVGQTVAHIRGGAYLNAPGSVRCAARWAGWPLTKRSCGVGFRVVREDGP